MEYKKSSKEKEVYSYENTKGKLWMYRHKYYDTLTGRRKEKKKSGFKTEKAAIKALLEVKALTLRGETTLINNDNLTISQWLDTWYESNQHKWKITTLEQRELAIRLYIKPLLGHYKLAKLDKVTYEKVFIRELEKTHRFSTIKHIHTIFKIIINAAVDAEIIPRNRFTNVSFTKKDAVDGNETAIDNYLTPNELLVFLETAKQKGSITAYSVFLTIAYTGIRRGEACGIQWRNIDFEKSTIRIERTRDYKGSRSPKTKNSYRTILVDEIVMKQLKIYKTQCKHIMLSFGKLLSDDDYVFISFDSAEPIPANYIVYRVAAIQEAAGLVRTVEEDGEIRIKPKITTHGLRHTHATMLLNSGINVKVIAERLGNTTNMIYNVYGHVLKELEHQSVEAFNNMLNANGAKFGAN